MGHATVAGLLDGWRWLGLSVRLAKIGAPSSCASQGALAAPERRRMKKLHEHRLPRIKERFKQQLRLKNSHEISD